MTERKTCELEGCDNPVNRKASRFCSRAHGHAGQARPGKGNLPPRERCTRDLHPLTGTNLRVDSLGRRSCKACAAIAARKRKGAPDAPTRTRSKPKPRPTPRPAPAAAPTQPVWRPAGFTPAPTTRREAS